MKKLYKTTPLEELLCRIVHKIKKNNRCPGILRKLSRKRYGREDSLARYYIEKYTGVPIGKYSYGYDFFGICFLKSVGAYCSIAEGATGVHGNHHMELVSTSPILTDSEFGFTEKNYSEESYFHSIEIGNDVWIGAGALIFPFVKIGDGAVIGAGSIIRKDVPPYAVVVGVDRIVKYRFSPDVIAKLLEIKWWNWDEEKIRENYGLMYDIDKFVNTFYKETKP